MIEILRYERANKNKIIGYVDIKIPKWGMIIRKIAHFQSGDKRWFNLPTFFRENKDGSPNYLRYWELEQQAHNGQLLESLHDKVKQYCLENKIAEIEPVDFSKPMVEADLPF